MRSSNPPHTVPHCVEWTRRGRLDVSHHQSNIGRAQHNDQPPSRSSTGNRGQYNTSDDGFSFSRRLSLLLLRTYEVSCRSRSTWSILWVSILYSFFPYLSRIGPRIWPIDRLALSLVRNWATKWSYWFGCLSSFLSTMHDEEELTLYVRRLGLSSTMVASVIADCRELRVGKG